MKSQSSTDLRIIINVAEKVEIRGNLTGIVNHTQELSQAVVKVEQPHTK